MIRLLIYSPLIIAIVFTSYLLKVYLDNSTKAPDSAQSVFKMAMDNSGFTDYESNSRHSIKKFSMVVNQGVSEFRDQMEFVSDQRRKIMDQVADQKQRLEDQRRNAQAIKDAIARNSLVGLNVDLMRINSLLDVLERQDQILEESNARLTNLNNGIREKMEAMKSQMRMKDLGESSNQDYIRDRMETLRNQSANLRQDHDAFVHSANQYVNLAHEQTKGVTQQLVDTNNYLMSLRGPSNGDLKEHVKELLLKEEVMMQKIRNNQELINQQRQEMKQRMTNISEKIDDMMQQNNVKVRDARMKAEDSNRQNKERIADQMQRIRQQQLDRKH